MKICTRGNKKPGGARARHYIIWKIQFSYFLVIYRRIMLILNIKRALLPVLILRLLNHPLNTVWFIRARSYGSDDDQQATPTRFLLFYVGDDLLNIKIPPLPPPAICYKYFPLTQQCSGIVLPKKKKRLKWTSVNALFDFLPGFLQRRVV